MKNITIATGAAAVAVAAGFAALPAPALAQAAPNIAEFQAEELEHRDTAREAGAAQAVGYPLLTAAIRAGCRVAIGLSKRI